MSDIAVAKKLKRLRGEVVMLSAKLPDHHASSLLEVSGTLLRIEREYEARYLRKDRYNRRGL